MMSDEMESMIRTIAESDFTLQLDNLILNQTYMEVVDKAVEKLGLDPEKFDWWCNCMDNGMTYKGEMVTSWGELEDIAEKQQQTKNTEK